VISAFFIANPVYFRAAVDDDIDLLGLARILRDEWRTIALSTLAVAALAITASLLMTPVYRAEAVVVEVETTPKGIDSAAALLGQVTGLAALANVNLVEPSVARTTLQSRSLAEEFISRQELLPVLYADDWDAAAGGWHSGLESPPALTDGALMFIEDVVAVQTDTEAGTIRLAVEWTDAARAAAWANDYVALANDSLRRRDVAEAERNVAFLNRKIGETPVVEMQRMLYGLLETEQQTIMLANSRDEYAFKVIDPAIAPQEPVRPAKLVMAAAGVLLGGVLGLAIVFFRRLAARLRRS
jgi:uncharacterized protein involved in exopolysaccharide biosynthesis